MKKSVSFPPVVPQSSTRAMASRSNGSYGGEARAAKYEPSILSEWASRGGNAVLEKYGREYFVELRKRRNLPKPPEPSWPSPQQKKYMRRIAAQENGRKGGYSRAELFYPECRQAMAREGGIATKNRYGNDFFREIRKKRTYYRKHFINVRTWRRIREEALQKAKNEQNFMVKYLWRELASWYQT